ncbi:MULTISPECIES: MarR family winged helix-turn-helix transcriptional regulator [Aestuariimicrobium]|uniref:MarR family winged helix-turn-helix transcriptional regulator n=1 Tax=Aestuariimicrobium TaxID=396388 RepID=UPI0003B4A910|nr:MULTISPECIES: MarR family transcriptional regulator [Aestuariimicrobium]CAI9409115.1 hypothetical protein AESSP_02169 [Aestuariimicrobium sp. T2.26MG-19.2B]
MSEQIADEVLRAVARINRWASSRSTFELPTAQARLLGHIDDLQPVRVTTLAAADHSSQPGVTAQVNRLQEAGLVERVADDTDARASLLRLTSKGAQSLARTRHQRARTLAPLLDELPPDQLDDLRRGLAVLTDLLTPTAPTSRKD